MNKVELGGTGDQVSCMALGTMYFGSKVSEQTSFGILDYYSGQGGGFLDSANKYASWVPGFRGGESESLVGRWMKKRSNRNQLFISSKVGLPYDGIPQSLKKEIIITECEKSLERLGTDTIDLFFAHAFDPGTPAEEVMEAFYRLKKEGKIRHAGASNYYAWQLSEANAIASRQGWEGFCCLQQRHSCLEPSLRANFGNQLLLTPEIQAFCMNHNLSVMAYSPLLGGIYSRSDRPLPVQYQSRITEFRLNLLRKVAGELNIPANAVVLAWMMQGSPKVIPVVAGSSVLQMEENMKALTVQLSEEQLAQLNQEIAQPDKY